MSQRLISLTRMTKKPDLSKVSTRELIQELCYRDVYSKENQEGYMELVLELTSSEVAFLKLHKKTYNKMG